MLDSSTPGWQNIETCGCVIIESKECGLAALLLIGMSQVSSVNFEQGIKVRASFKKGDMLGYFLFGGSDYMILFQDKVKFSLTVPTDKNGKYSHLSHRNTLAEDKKR